MNQTQWNIEKSKRTCSISGKLFQPGETYFSGLYDENGQLLRKDFSEETWASAPKNFYSCWKTKVPEKTDAKPVLDYAMLNNLFFRLVQEDMDEKKQQFCYIVALLLMRKRILKFEDSYAENGKTYLLLRHSADQHNYKVLDPRLGDDDLINIKNELSNLLQSDLDNSEQ